MTDLVEIRNLNVRFTGERTVYAVNDLSLSLGEGEVLGLLGESGSGKSVTLRALMRLLPKKRTQISGSVRVLGRDVLALDDEQLSAFRGQTVSMIFQEPALALDPVYTIGRCGRRFTPMRAGCSPPPCTAPNAASGWKRSRRTPPSLDRAPTSCSFAPRCGFAEARCVERPPPNVPVGSDRIARCILAERAEAGAGTS